MIDEQADSAQQNTEDQDRKLIADRFHEQELLIEWIKKIYEKRGKKIHGTVVAEDGRLVAVSKQIPEE